MSRPAAPALRRATLAGALVAPLSFAAVSFAALALAACSPPNEVPPAVDPALGSTVAELQREVAALKAERDATLKAAGITGTEHRTLVQAVADLRDEVDRLKQRPSAGAPSSGATSGTTSGATTDDRDAPTPRLPTTFLPQNDGSFNEEQIVAFRALEDAVRQRREEEQQRSRLRESLEAQGVQLTAAQQEALLRLQREFGDKRNALVQSQRTLGRASGDPDAEVLRAKFEELRTQHLNEVRAVVPPAEADKVVEALRRSYPGFFPRGDANAGPGRRGGTGRGGN